mmetsp:Transcript_115417/g.337514  ORF Transcript_115417/g.337514 Transcript_115417/m.337514 type:complete len:220 (+) Transcript_115417:4676-5335(+)
MLGQPAVFRIWLQPADTIASARSASDRRVRHPSSTKPLPPAQLQCQAGHSSMASQTCQRGSKPHGLLLHHVLPVQRGGGCKNPGRMEETCLASLSRAVPFRHARYLPCLQRRLAVSSTTLEFGAVQLHVQQWPLQFLHEIDHTCRPNELKQRPSHHTPRFPQAKHRCQEGTCLPLKPPTHGLVAVQLGKSCSSVERQHVIGRTAPPKRARQTFSWSHPP